MALLLPNLRQVIKYGRGIKDQATAKAVGALEDWADELVRRLSRLEQTSGAGGGVPTTRAINTTSPLAGGGDLSADRTLTVADNSTASKGVVATAPNDTTKFWRGDASWAGVGLGGLQGLLMGLGTDGSLNFDGVSVVAGLTPASGVYSMNQDLAGTSVTVGSGVTLLTNNYRLFCTGRLTNNGTIGNYGLDSTGSAGTSSRPAGVFSSIPGAPAGSTSGGTGSAGSSSSAASRAWTTVAAAPTNANGAGSGQGAGGGSAGSSNGGTGGAVTIVPTTQGYFDLIQGVTGRSMTSQLSAGSCGGGGGQSGSGGGGGGGAGGQAGGRCYVGAQEIDGSGVFSCKGGNGADAVLGSAAGAGGGGGGGGGFLVIVCGNISGSWTTTAAGGTGGAGAGTGNNGGNGSAGTVVLIA